MITLQELCEYLNRLLDCGSYTDACKNGCQVEGSAKIKTIATAVSASLATIEEAVKLKIDALIVHHGLFWNSDGHAITGAKREKLRLLLENDISLLAYHLPLDAHPQIGNNWKAAQEMGWSELEPFGFYNGKLIGVKGKIKSMHRTDFKLKLEEYYQHTAHDALGGKETIATAALISGGAYRSLSEAAAQGLDCFITGNFDEPAWNQAFEDKINFFALGHSATEKIGPKALGNHLADQFKLSSTFINNQNPF